MRFWTFFVAIAVIASPDISRAATYYVAKTGSDINTCAQAQSVSTPKLTISAASGGASCMSGGDTLYVRSGNYNEILYAGRNPFGAVPVAIPSGTTSANPTTVAGYAGDARPIITTTGKGTGDTAILFSLAKNVTWDGINFSGSNLIRNSTSVVYIDSPQNITIRNAEIYNAPAHGLLMGDSAAQAIVNIRFLNLKIHDCGINYDNSTQPPSHCMYLNATNFPSSGVVLDGLEIYNARGCGGCYGIQIYRYGGSGGNLQDFTVRNSYIHDNTNAMVVGSGSNLKVYNNVIANNGTGTGISVPGINIGYNTADNVQVYNNTVYNNKPGAGIGNDGFGTVTNAKVQNNILWSNGNGNNIGNLGSGQTSDHNLTGAMDPMFVNAANNDFHLMAGSPAIGAGATIALVTTDKDGNPRTPPYDIGAYAYGTPPPPPPPPSLQRSLTLSVNSGPCVLGGPLTVTSNGTSGVWSLPGVTVSTATPPATCTLKMHDNSATGAAADLISNAFTVRANISGPVLTITQQPTDMVTGNAFQPPMAGTKTTAVAAGQRGQQRR